MTTKKAARPIRASKKVREAMEQLKEASKPRRGNKIKRRSSASRKKGKPVPLKKLKADLERPTEFVLCCNDRRGRLLRLSFTGATVELDPHEVVIKYYLGEEEVKRYPREIVVISAEAMAQEVY